MLRLRLRRLCVAPATWAAGLVSVLYLLYYSSNAAWLPFFYPYLRDIGMSGMQVGLLSAIRPSVMVVSQPLWGVAADAWGRRRLLLLAALAVALVLPGYWLGQTFPFLVVWTILLALLHNPIGLLTDSVALDHLEQHGSPTYGALRFWGAAGWAIVAVLTGRWLSGRDARLMFPLAGAFLLLMCLVALRLRQEGMTRRHLRRPWVGVGDLLRRRTLVVFLVVAMAVQFGTAPIFSFYSIYLGELGASRDLIGLASSIQGLAELPVYLGAAWIIRRIGSGRALTLSLMTYTTRMLLYSIIRNPVLAVATEVLHGLSFSLFMVSAIGYVNERTPARWRATGQSLLWAASHGAGAILGSAWGGWLFDRAGVHMLYRVNGLFILAAAVASVALLWRKEAGEAQTGIPAHR